MVKVKYVDNINFYKKYFNLGLPHILHKYKGLLDV
jgi:hypothetical protein